MNLAKRCKAISSSAGNVTYRGLLGKKFSSQQIQLIRKKTTTMKTTHFSVIVGWFQWDDLKSTHSGKKMCCLDWDHDLIRRF